MGKEHNNFGKEQSSYQKVNLSVFMYLSLRGLIFAFELWGWLFAP